jgi:xylulokinase
VVFNKHGDILSREYIEYPLIRPAEGWAELDSEFIWVNIKKTLIRTKHRVKKDKITAFSISSQGEAVIPIDREGNCLYNAIVSFDSRTMDQYRFWEGEISKKKIFKITGMPLHPMYSINKIMWFKDKRKDIFKRAYKFLCFEDYIFMKFGFNPTIDYSLAARTMAFDINLNNWSKEILNCSGINEELFAEIRPSGVIVEGNINKSVASEIGLNKDIYGVTGGHDQACGAFGAGIVNEKFAMNAIGTSDVIAPIFRNINVKDTMLENNYPCYPYVLKDKYITIGFNLTGGLLLKWYRDNFCFEEDIYATKNNKNIYEIIDENINKIPVNIFILPHFVGSGTPYLDYNSRGLIMGLDIETDKSKISRAILESNTYDLKLNLEKLKLSKIYIDRIISIGGGSRSSTWLKIRADILGKKIITLKNSEAASLGAAMLAGLAIKEYKSIEQAVESTVREDKSFEPDMDNYKKYNEKYLIYKDIYRTNKDLLNRIANLSEAI